MNNRNLEEREEALPAGSTGHLVGCHNESVADLQQDKALILAAYHGHEKNVANLLDAGANLQTKDKALIVAASIGHEKMVEKLLATGAIDDAHVEFAYASIGHEKIVEKLLVAGANVDVQDNDGDTALILAAYVGREKIVEKLLAAGANVDVQNRNGETALSHAADRSHKESFAPKL